MTHPTGDYETGRNVCQHVGQWKLSHLHEAASSARRDRLFFLVGVNKEHTGFFMISAIEMKGEGGCEGGGGENNSSTKPV